MHVSTNEFIIRNALMFREGDIVDSYKLSYSERYIRSLSYIGDVRLTVIPISENEAEILVVVQDNFPYSATFDTNFSTQAQLSVTNKNIIGLGLDLNAGAMISSRKEHLMGYRAILRSSNIGRSFVSFEAIYSDMYENQRYGVTIKRDFYAPTTKYAGHLIYNDTKTPARYCDPENGYPELTTVSIRYKQFDTWLGRSFQITDNSGASKQLKNFTVSLRAQRIYFVNKPENSAERYYKFQNRTTYLASLSYSIQSFYKSSLIYNFGRTEDIPYGDILTVIAGREINELYNRPYIGVNYSTGYFVPKMGYVSGSFAYGTFFQKKPDQGVFDLEINYFTNLYVLGNYRMRTFANGHYTGQLFNRLEDQLVIDGDNGIPGFRNDSVLGRHRFNVSLEQDIFMPREVLGFRFVIYAFTYISWLGEYSQPVILNNLYSSFGLGIRIRNNRLIFNTIQLQFAWFPNIPDNSRFRYFNASRETVLQPRDFVPKAPEVMPLY